MSTRTTIRGEQTKEAILEASIASFRRGGFESATLEGIGDALGMTRSAVLYHYGSKDEILAALIRPALSAIDHLLDRVEQTAPLTARQQRRFLAELIDILVEHRDAVAVMTRDITVQRHLDDTLQLSDRTARFAAIMASAHQDDVAVVRAMAALGAIVRPLGVPDDALDLASPAHRRALLDCAVAALRSGRH